MHLHLRWVVVKIMVPFWVPLNIRCRIIIGIQKRAIILTTTQILYLGVAGVATAMFNVQSRFSSQESKDPYDELRTEIRNKVHGWQHCDLPCKPLPSHCEAFMCG